MYILIITVLQSAIYLFITNETSNTIFIIGFAFKFMRDFSQKNQG